MAGQKVVACQEDQGEVQIHEWRLVVSNGEVILVLYDPLLRETLQHLGLSGCPFCKVLSPTGASGFSSGKDFKSLSPEEYGRF